MKMLPWEIAQTKTSKDGKYKILSIFREKEVQSNPNQTSRRNTTQLNIKPYGSQIKTSQISRSVRYRQLTLLLMGNNKGQE